MGNFNYDVVFHLLFDILIICAIVIIMWLLGFIYPSIINRKHTIEDFSSLYSKISKIKAGIIFIMLAIIAISILSLIFILVESVFDVEVLPITLNELLYFNGISFAIFMHILPLNGHLYNNIQSSDELMFSQYGPNGRLKDWSSATDAYRKKINWNEKFTSKAYDAMVNSKIIESAQRNPIHIIGPTANSGECELALAEEVAKHHTPGVIMDASDILENSPHVPSFVTGNIVFNYREGMNVDDLNNYYKEPLDVIFDNKGALWHKLSSSKSLVNAEQLLTVYHSLLKVGGIIIIDGYPMMETRNKIAQMQLQLFKKISWFAEASTSTKLKPVYEKSSTIQGMFDIREIENGLSSVMYLIKK